MSTLAPPSIEQLIERLQQSSEPEPEQRLAAALGLPLDELTGLRARAEGRRDLTFHWQRRLNLQFAQRGSVLVVRSDRLGSWAKTTQVAELLHNAALDLNLRLALIASRTQPEHPLLCGEADGDWLVLACPIAAGEQRVQVGGFRFPASPLSEAPVGWQPLRLDQALIGWLSPDGHVLRLRFHPLLSRDGRLTVSRAGERRELLRRLIVAAQAQRPATLSADLAAHAAWQQTLELAEAIEATAASGAAHLTALHARARNEQRVAARQVEQLTSQLIEQIRVEREAARRLEEVTPLLQQERQSTLSLVADALAAAKEQPQVSAAAIQDGALRLELHDGRAVVLQLAPQQGVAPARRPDGCALDLGEAFLPLANAIANGNVRAALAILLGQLAHGEHDSS